VNFVALEIINRRTQHNSLCRDKDKHYVPSYMMVKKEMSHVMLPGMLELSPALSIVA
jgi:hypothetical protein